MTPATFATTASRGKWRLARHLAEIDRAIVETIRDQSPRILLIEAPPRHGKSELVSHYLPAWYLGMFPDRKVILASYEADFAKSWGRKARDLYQIVSPTYFGTSLSRDVAGAKHWQVARHGGAMFTAGVGGPITGKGANLLIVDDPIKNAEQALSPKNRDKQWEWWQSTAWTRMEPQGVAVVMATRWHDDDLTGRLIKAAESGEGEPVRRLRLPAICEDEDDALGREIGEALWSWRWPIEELRKRQRSSDLFWWLAMYQQRPSRYGRQEWPDEYFDDLFESDWPDRFETTVMATDPSKGKDARKGDFAAIVSTSIARGKIWVDSSIERRPPNKIVSDGIDMAQEHPVDHFGVESNQFQSLLADEYDRQCAERNLMPLPIALIENTVNKELRISRIGPYLARKHLRFRQTPSNELLIRQLMEFPIGDHDDGPDALEMALRLLKWSTSQEDDFYEERVSV